MSESLEPDHLNVETLAAVIDHTLLQPDHTVEDVERVCLEAITYGFHTVCVPPYDIERVVALLHGTDVAAGAAVGVPFGHDNLEAKRAAACHAIESGADEIDMLINLVAMKSGRYADVRAEIAALRKIAEGGVLKVILECCYLSDEEKARGCELALEAGADFVKTSTGFGPGGATVHDVHLLVQAVGGRALVKAAGGIRTFLAVQEFLKAGAARIGTSAGPAIIQDFQNREDV
jgi:deoxyribose-phosphate aldolase